MTPPHPQKPAEIAERIAFASSADHGHEEAGLRGWQKEQIEAAILSERAHCEGEIERLTKIINDIKEFPDHVL